MGHAENAQVHYAEAKQRLAGKTKTPDQLLLMAQVEATLAMLHALDGLQGEVSLLTTAVEAK